MFNVLISRLLCVFFSILIFDVANASDVVAQNYSVANSADLQSVCTQGYDLLAGDVSYGKNRLCCITNYKLLF